MLVDRNKIISNIMILIYSVWVILPRVQHTISVVFIAMTLFALLIFLCIRNKSLTTFVVYIMFGMVALSLMYLLVAYPLDFKHAVIVVMEQFMMFLPLILAYNAIKNYTKKEILVFLVLIALLELYVGFTTYIELQSNPMIARMLTSGTSEESKDISYRLANIGGYGSIYSFVFFYISGLVSVFYIKRIIFKIISIAICIFSFLLLMEAQFGTAIMLLILSSILMIFAKANSVQTKIIALFSGIIIVFILPTLLNILADYAGAGILSERLTAISEVLQNKTTNDVDLVLRQQLLREGFTVFFQSPLWGQKISENGVKVINLYSHSSYLDLACATGIIGLGIYLKTWAFANKTINNCLNTDNKKFYILGYVIFCILGMMNPNWAVYQINIIAFLYFPLVLYILQDNNSLKEEKSNTDKFFVY